MSDNILFLFRLFLLRNTCPTTLCTKYFIFIVTSHVGPGDEQLFGTPSTRPYSYMLSFFYNPCIIKYIAHKRA